MSEPDPITVPQGIPEIEASTRAPEQSEPEVLIITGMSGAGRSRAAGVLEEQRSGRWAGGAEPEQAARTLVGLADGLRLQRLLGHPELDHAALLRTHLQAMRIGGTTP